MDGGWKANNDSRTLYICNASSLDQSLLELSHLIYGSICYLVGDTIMAPIWCFLMGSSNRSSFSTTGIKKDKVFPLPVTASTTTSLWPMKRGIVDAWTGVIRENPMAKTASRIHPESGGFKDSQAREEDVAEGDFGAIESPLIDRPTRFPFLLQYCIEAEGGGSRRW
jgi:hypothetical protein